MTNYVIAVFDDSTSKLELTVISQQDGVKINLSRDKNEPLHKSITRLALNWQKSLQKVHGKTKRKPRKDGTQDSHAPTAAALNSQTKGSVLDLPTVVLHKDTGEDVSEDMICVEAFSVAKCLAIGDVVFAILVNPPRVVKCNLPPEAMCNHPIPVNLLVASAPLSEFNVEWYLVSAKDSTAEKPGRHYPSRPHTFYPTESDVGMQWGCRVSHPSLPMIVVEARGDKPVRPGPPHSWRDCRVASFCTPNDTTDFRLRIVSFNLLADKFAKTGYALETSYPYCSAEFLELSYRQLLISKEIVECNSDFYGFQECSRPFFRTILQPLLQSSHFGLMKPKVSRDLYDKFEGSALFYDFNKYRLQQYFHGDLVSLILQEPGLREVLVTLNRRYPTMLHDLRKVGTIFQLAAFVKNVDDSPPLVVLVSNTHLYYDNDAKHIRILQAAALKSFVQNTSQNIQRQYDGCVRVECLMCGDFNTPPHAAAAQYLRGVPVPADHRDWLDALVFEWAEEAVAPETEEVATGTVASAPERTCANKPSETEGSSSLTTQSGSNGSALHYELEMLPKPFQVTPIHMTLVESNKCVEELSLRSTAELQALGDCAAHDLVGVDVAWPLDQRENTTAPQLEMYDCHLLQRTATSTFTHKVAPFCSTLDYIFATKTLQVEKLNDPMKFEWLPGQLGIPCEVYGSDHVAIAAEFSLKR